MKKEKFLAMLMVAALSAGMLAISCGSDNTKEKQEQVAARF